MKGTDDLEWCEVASINLVGEAECVCIQVAHPSQLYVTDDGIITHNTTVDVPAHDAASSPTNDRPEPTDGQKKAGNYKKGHVRISGLDISIENPVGSVRSGKDKGGRAWSRTMESHYGYIRGTEGKDGDHVDVFILPDTPTNFDGAVFVVNQRIPNTSTFDEHKVVLGAANQKEARDTYFAAYEPGWKGLLSMAVFPTVGKLKEWLSNGNQKTPAKTVPWNPEDTWRLPPPLHTAPRAANVEHELAKIRSEASRAAEFKAAVDRGEVDRKISEHGGFFKDINGWLTRMFAGRYDRLEYFAPGVKTAIENNKFSEAYAVAAINRMMERVKKDLFSAFGDPRFWSKQKARLNRYLDQLLPVAARLEVEGIDQNGRYTFKPFEMRAGTIKTEVMKLHGFQSGQTITWTNRQGEIEQFVIGFKIADEDAHVLMRPMSAELQEGIYDAFIQEFPEGVSVLDQYISPDLRDATFRGPGNVETAVFNRHALLKAFNEWPQELRDLFGAGELPGIIAIDGYTPDVAAQKTIGAFISSLLNRYKSPGRLLKAGELRESGNIMNLLDGFSTRAMEAHREKIRIKTRRDLIESAARDKSGIPDQELQDHYVPLDDTFGRLYEAVAIAKKLDRNKYPALTGALNPAQEKMLMGIVGDMYRLSGKGLVIHKEVQRELMASMAMERTENTWLRTLEWLIDRMTKGQLFSLGSYATNWVSAEIMKGMVLANRFNFAVISALTGDPRAAKLGAYEFSHLLRGFFTDRVARLNQRISSAVPVELLEDNSGLAMLDDNRDLSALDSMFGYDPKSPMAIVAGKLSEKGYFKAGKVAATLARRLDPGGAFLKAIGYGNVDTNPKMAMIYRMLRAKADVAADQAKLSGQSRKDFVLDWVTNAHRDQREAFREAYRDAQFWYMDYANVPAFLDPSQFTNQWPRVLVKATFPFMKWGYNMLRQVKGLTTDSVRDLTFPGKTARERREAAAKLMTMAGLTALGAVLTGGDDEDDEPFVGSSVDGEGKLLDVALRTGNRINISRGARFVHEWAQRFGIDLPGEDYTISDANGEEADAWLRYRNYPYLREMILLGFSATGNWSKMWEQTEEMLGEYASFGISTKLIPITYKLSPFDRNKSYPFVATEALYDLVTAPVMPPRLRDAALRMIDPVQRRAEKLDSWDYHPGAWEAILANTPGLSDELPPAGKPRTGSPAPFHANQWLKGELGKIKKNTSLNPEQRKQAIAQVLAEYKDMPKLSPGQQREVLIEAGMDEASWAGKKKSNVPLANEVTQLNEKGLTDTAFKQLPKGKVSVIPTSNMSITDPSLEILRQLTGANVKAAPRGAVSRALKAEDLEAE